MDLKTHEQSVSHYGFTLLEMVVSVSIGLLLTGWVIANYNSHNDVQTLKQAGLTLKNDLRFAQTKALSGEKPTPTPPTPNPTPTPICTQLVGYTVTFCTAQYHPQPICTWGAGSQQSYAIQAFCNPEGALGMITTTLLPNGVTFSPSTPNSFVFKVLAQGSSLSATTPLTLDGFGKQYIVSVNPDGGIDDKGLQ